MNKDLNEKESEERQKRRAGTLRRIREEGSNEYKDFDLDAERESWER